MLRVACFYLYLPMRKQFIYLFIYFVFSGSAAQRGLWPPRPRGFLITHNDAPHSLGLLWTSDQLITETSTWQQTHNRQTSMPPLGIFYTVFILCQYQNIYLDNI
jgi:hypothetical protein